MQIHSWHNILYEYYAILNLATWQQIQIDEHLVLGLAKGYFHSALLNIVFVVTYFVYWRKITKPSN